MVKAMDCGIEVSEFILQSRYNVHFQKNTLGNGMKPLILPPRGVMVKAMGCGIVVSEFVLQSRYKIHFQTNTLGNGMKPLILPAMG